MDGKNSKNHGVEYANKSSMDSTPDSNRNIPKGLLHRELGHKQKLGAVPQEFQAVAEDKLVSKTHEELRCELPGPARSTFLMVFSPDGTKVASTHGNHNVYVTDLTTGKNVNTLSGHPRTPWCIAFHPSSNQILASGCLGGQVRVWDLHGGSEVWMADGQTVIASLAFHPTDRMLVIATYNELHFWDWSRPEPFTKCYTNNEKEKVRYVTFDPLGHKLITGISNAPHIQSQWDQWDRVSTGHNQNASGTNSGHSGQNLSPLMAPDRERRITVCYRSLVEQYEQLVQRYFDLSRSRSISTMDRGTDPMDFEGDASTSSSTRLREGAGASADGAGGAGPSRWREVSAGTSSTNRAGASGSERGGSNSRYLKALFCNPWQRSQQERPASRADSATATSETEPVAGSSSNSGGPTTTTNPRQRSESLRIHLNPRCRLLTADRPAISASNVDSLRRRSSMSALDSARPLTRGLSNPAPTTPAREGRPEAEESRPRMHGESHSHRHSVLLPSRPRRFFVSQTSAFQPRVPRSEHASEPRDPARSVLTRRATQRISLNAATAAAVAAQDRRTPDPDAPRSRSPLTPLSSARSRADMTDVGVRYGIQLLSRHIDNMQRLCRARLEILQLQQIRRMWEDLQRQIRSLHSAVRESSITLARLTESTAPEADQFSSASSAFPPNANTTQSPGTEAGTRESAESSSDGNSGHIPRVSQMLELARISDSSPAGLREATSASGSPGHPREGDTGPPSEESAGSAGNAGQSAEFSEQAGTSPAGNGSDDAANNPQYSFRYQMLQQRLWRISRKVYLRRPRLLTVNSRSMRRQLSSSHTPLSRSSASQARHSDSSRRPWFLHSVSRSHRSGTKSTNNVSSQVDPSNAPGKPEPKPSNSDAQPAATPVDDSQPGPSGLCNNRPGSSSNAAERSRLDMILVDCTDEDDDSDMEEPVETADAASAETASGGGGGEPVNAAAAIAAAAATISPNTLDASEEQSAIRQRLLEEIDRLFPSVAQTPSTSSDGNSGASTSRGTGSRERPGQQEPSACKSLWSMIARLERLVQQQREQRERLRSFLSNQNQSRRSSTWGLRDRTWQRVENSGSDSDSNTEAERPRPWGRMSAEERLTSALETEVQERERMCRAAASAGSQGGSQGQLEEDWEWTRESTRLRARQVLSLMVESLTQFFEENGLSSSTPHAVVDEQIFNGNFFPDLHVLLQLALELTDLLLAQLVYTRRELEHQWVHRLRSPVALAPDDPRATRDREAERERDRDRLDEPTSALRMSPYRRLYRHRFSTDGDAGSRPDRSGPRNRTEFTRRLNSRVMNCLARHNRLTPHSGTTRNSVLRPGRNMYYRAVNRSLTPRSELSEAARCVPSRVSSNSPVHRALADSTSDAAGTEGRATGEEASGAAVPQPHDAFTVPLVRVNDVPVPDTSLLNQPRTRPQSPPLHHLSSPFANPFSQMNPAEQRPRGQPWDFWPYVPGSSWRPRFLHPRYLGPNIFNEDSEDGNSVHPGDHISYFRGHSGSETVIITDALMTPNHRIQVWDFSTFHIPDISNAEKNVIVPECKIHNDASVDVSKDGRLLVTLLPSGRQSITTMLGVYSLQWESLGQCLYTTSFLQSAVSVSLSPASRYLLVGLASRRVALLPNDRHYMAQVFRLDGAKPGRSVGGRGRLSHMRDIEQSRDQGYMSLNCIRWAPGPGQGFVYGTNTGQLRVLR